MAGKAAAAFKKVEKGANLIQHEEDNSEDFTAEQISECRDLFSMFDKDGGGTIDREEFAGMMKTLGLNLNERELDEFFAEMDVNNNGDIEFEELLTMLRKISRNISPEEEFQEAFRFFDLDGNGSLTKKELMRVLNSMGEDIALDEADEMIRSATGGSPEVDFETFKMFCLGAMPHGESKMGGISRPAGYSAMEHRRASGEHHPELLLSEQADSAAQGSPGVSATEPGHAGQRRKPSVVGA